MHALKVPRVTLFHMHHHPQNVLPPVASRYLGLMSCHPVVPKLEHMYAHRERGTLWWSVSPAKMVRHKKVIRSWCARRIRHAFRDALRERGFDGDGKAVVVVNGEVVGRERGLSGTLDIRMNEEMFGARYVDVQKQAGFLVDHLRAMTLRSEKKMGTTDEGFPKGGYKRKGKK